MMTMSGSTGSQEDCSVSGLRVVDHPASFDPASDAIQLSSLRALQKCLAPMWIYSCTTRAILWSNQQANTVFARDLAAPLPPHRVSEGSSPESILSFGDSELHCLVEENGCSAEVDVICRKRSYYEISRLPGWPAAVPNRPSPSVNISFKLVYDPIYVIGSSPETAATSDAVCCLVQLQGGNMQHSEMITQRLMAMNDNCPIFRFMFDSTGKLLQANQPAVSRYKETLGDDELTLWGLFELGLYPSEEHRHAVYHKALHTVFEKHETFRCQQERISRASADQRKWVELEMWPMIDPVTGQPAVQVSQMSLTKTKKVEVDLQTENDQLQTTKEALEAQLQEKYDLIRFKHRSLSIKSPMEKLVDMFDNLMEGGDLPDMQTLMNYRMMIATASDLRLPSNLVGELLQDDMFEKDVGLSILQQLGYRLSKTHRAKNNPDPHDAALRPSGRSSSSSDMGNMPDLEPMGDEPLMLHPPTDQNAFTQSSRDFSTSIVAEIRASRSSVSASPSSSFDDTTPEPLQSRSSLDYAMAEKRSAHSSDTFALSEMSTMPVASPSGHCVVPVLEQVLRKVHTWDFNVFQLNDVSHGNPLSALAFFLLKQSGLTRWFHLDEQALSLWLRSVEEQYQNNQYHNRIHAAGVTHSMFAMITLGGLHQGLSRLQMLAALLAAVVHDVDHPGNTNDFLVAADDELAIDYNDNSPLENHHLRTTFRLMRRPEYNFISRLDTDQYRTLRSLMIELVLATDMKRHFDILSQFQVGLSVRQNKEAISNSGDSPVARAAGGVRNLWERIPDKQMDDAQHALKLKVALKVADLGHLASPSHIHREWVERLQEEFFCQGDREKSLNLPVSPLMDRTKPGITTAQLGFFEVVAMPLYESLVTAYSTCRPLIQALQSNYDMWAKPEEPVKISKMRKRQNTV